MAPRNDPSSRYIFACGYSRSMARGVLEFHGFESMRKKLKIPASSILRVPQPPAIEGRETEEGRRDISQRVEAERIAMREADRLKKSKTTKTLRRREERELREAAAGRPEAEAAADAAAAAQGPEGMRRPREIRVGQNRVYRAHGRALEADPDARRHHS